MKKLSSILLSVCMFVSLSLTINAEETEEVPQEPEQTQEAEETTKEDEETIPETFEEDGEEVEETTEDVEETPENEKEELEEPTTSPDYTDDEKEAVADRYDDLTENIDDYEITEATVVIEENGDSTLVVKTPARVAVMRMARNGKETNIVEIDGTGYTSISAALEAISSSSETKTIKLISDEISENVKITGNKKVILDLNGKILKNNNDEQNTTKDTIFVEIGSALTIKDLSEAKTGKVNNNFN